MANILSDDMQFSQCSPSDITRAMALRVRERRLELNLTQEGLSKKSGVSLGTLKRFENKYEISLKHLLMLAVVLGATEAFENLFSRKQYQSIDDLLDRKQNNKRKRGSRNV